MSAGGLFTLYSYHTLYVVETVCKQFINGSVPVGFSLNSGFDTGDDSWLSGGSSLAGGHTVQKMPAGIQVLRGWRGGGVRGAQVELRVTVSFSPCSGTCSYETKKQAFFFCSRGK